MSEASPALAALFEAAEEADPAVLLGRVLGSLPLHVLLTDRSPELLVRYCSSRVLESAGAGHHPIAGHPLGDALPELAASGVLDMFREAAATGEHRRFQGFVYPGARGRLAWDGAIYPLGGVGGSRGYLLIVAAETPKPDARLTARERQVAELVAAGFSNAAIARRLFLGRSTVATHVAHILDKLDFRSRSQIGAWLEATGAWRRPTAQP